MSDTTQQNEVAAGNSIQSNGEMEMHTLIQEIASEVKPQLTQQEIEIQNQKQILAEIKQARDEIKTIANHIHQQNELATAMKDSGIDADDVLHLIVEMERNDLSMSDIMDIMNMIRKVGHQEIEERVQFFYEHDLQEVENILDEVDNHGGIDTMIECVDLLDGKDTDEVEALFYKVSKLGGFHFVLKRLEAFEAIKETIISME